MELTITRKQAGRIYAAVKNHELDMDKGMVSRMYDEADWGAPRGLGGRDRKAQVSHLIEALNEGNEREAQMYAEWLWGDEDEAEAIAEELEAANKAEAKREAEANADEARAAKADAMLAKIGEITGKNIAGVEGLGVEKAEGIIANWSNMLSHRPEDWAEVVAAGEAAEAEAKGEPQDAAEAVEVEADEPETEAPEDEPEAETPEPDSIPDKGLYRELERLAAWPGYELHEPAFDRSDRVVRWTTPDGDLMEAYVRLDGFLTVVSATTGLVANHGRRCGVPFILGKWPSFEVAAEEDEYADLDELLELDELAERYYD